MQRVPALAVFAFVLLGATAPPTDHWEWERAGLSAPSKLARFDGAYYAATDNAVISDLEIHGNVVVTASNVTMRNSRLISRTPWHALRVMEGAAGFTLEDSEIDGGGVTANGIYGFGTFLRNDIHGVVNGINVVGPSIIRANDMHDFRGNEDSHYDGVEINGGHDIQINGNRIVNDHGQTSAVMMNNEFGGLSNILIENNMLFGGGYTIYLDGRKGGGSVDSTSIRIVGNRIGGGLWGSFAFYDSRPVVKGNHVLQ